MLLSGCKQKTNNNESTLSNQAGNITSTVEPQIDATIPNNLSFNFITALNVLKTNEEGSYESINDSQIECNSQELELRISTYAQPDDVLNWQTINLNLYVINNGKPIYFYNVANNRKIQKMSVTGNTNEGIISDIKIPMSELSGNNESLINILVDFAPEYIAERNKDIPGLNEFNGLASVSVLIKSDKINTSDDSYFQFPENNYVDIQSSDSFCDIGYQSNKNQILTDHFSQDVVINDEKLLYVKACTGENCSYDYMLCVFCNGEMLPILENKYFATFNTQAGKKVLNYCLNG